MYNKWRAKKSKKMQKSNLSTINKLKVIYKCRKGEGRRCDYVYKL